MKFDFRKALSVLTAAVFVFCASMVLYRLYNGQMAIKANDTARDLVSGSEITEDIPSVSISEEPVPQVPAPPVEEQEEVTKEEQRRLWKPLAKEMFA